MMKRRGIKSFLIVLVLASFFATAAWGELCSQAQLHEIKAVTKETKYITYARAVHILCGDKTGGGHFYPGNKGKTAFPKDWTIRDVLISIDQAVENTPRRDWRGPQSNGNYYIIRKKYHYDPGKTAITLKTVIRKNCMVVTAYPQR
ncbi:MAG: EndoU domain-containing protein [Syntrophobacterales bacterium]|jgi:hypothetical protein|nr:EndoU domain-containing protein [Syntrophobacterales bacterium]